MARKAILFVDLLGVQKMWAQGGASAVKSRIDEFSEFVIDQISYLPPDLHKDGDYAVILQGDSVSVTCKDFDQAIGIGIHLFTQAFYATDKGSHPLWLRGAIARWNNQYLTFNTEPIEAKGMPVGNRYVNEDDFLGVLALEKSGFRGMRMIVDKTILPKGGAEFRRDWSGFKKPLHIITRLEACSYPVGKNYRDILWMADDEDRYKHMSNIIASRFKKSTGDPDEFMQAAWTRAVFDQVDSLVWVCGK